MIRLLTAPEAAGQLGVAPLELDRLVDTGALAVLRVSARDGRRFWPADVEAVAASGASDRTPGADVQAPPTTTLDAGTDAPLSPEIASPALASAGVHRVSRRAAATRRRPAPQRPRWPAFAFEPHRTRAAYLSFRDPEHVVGYLQARTGRDTV